MKMFFSPKGGFMKKTIKKTKTTAKKVTPKKKIQAKRQMTQVSPMR
jgi:hypothetical protein